MFKKYLRERQSWIYLFFILQMLLLLIVYLDPSIPFSSIAYIVLLSFIVFIVFFIYRYVKESAFYKAFNDWYPSDDMDNLKEAVQPFEKIIEEKIKLQEEYYKRELDKNIQQLEEEKDDLLSWIHEVKTPLTTMQLMLGRVEDSRLKTKLTSEWLRIHLLLDQQLHQRRMNQMENDLYFENVLLKSVIYEEIKDLRVWCMQKGIGFDVSLEVEDVLTDGKWIRFIVRQLLTNAVKYSDHSEIMVRSFKEDDNVKLVIQDQGRGISKKDLPRIFDKGFTSTTNHQDHAATGMGLYLVKKAVDVLKINIEVKSKVDEGTIFTLTFPKKNELLKITSM